MYPFIFNLLSNLGTGSFTRIITYTAMATISLFGCLLLRSIVRIIADKTLKLNKNESPRIQELSKLIKRVSNLAIPIVLFLLAYELDENYTFLRIIAEISLVVVIMFIIFACVRSIVVIYSACEASRNIPIHGISQVITVMVSVIGGIVIISILMGINPAMLLGSIGAMTAIITLVFKDAILGFIAGIQLTTNNMVRVGDWIEVPNHHANGLVIDINMTTVKVENFDKTLTSIPAYTLISESFINWQGMIETSARRIKRPIYIDAATICICDDEMINKFKSIAILKDYIEDAQAENNHFNKNGDTTQKTNGQGITNITVFRAYIAAYLRNHPKIRHDLRQVVRQLDPGATGIPLEIIAFANATDAVSFEAIQADIFDHLYGVIRAFDLRLYQQPSGNDIRQMGILHSQSHVL